MVTDLVCDDISLGKIARRLEPCAHLLIKSEVDVGVSCRQGNKTGPSLPALTRRPIAWRR